MTDSNSPNNNKNNNALSHIDNKDSALALSKSKNLLAITDKILGTGIANRKVNSDLAINNDDWIQEIWDWADEFKIPDEEVPRDRDRLLAMTELRIDRYINTDYQFRNCPKITYLPDSIGQLTNLTTLGVFNNQLSQLPDWIGQLTNLTTLRVDSNYLNQLPDIIGQLTNLTWLSIMHNQLSELPDSIGQLTNLTHINLYNNQLNQLPDSIGQLTNLAELSVYYNQLSQLPDSITQLSNLEWLNIQKNPNLVLSENIKAFLRTIPKVYN